MGKENANKEEVKKAKKEARALKKEEKIHKQYEKLQEASKFKKWRNARPFWGATLTVLAGLMILYIPLHLYAIAFIPGSLVFVGFLFGGLTLIIGILSFFFPQFSTIFGIFTLFLSVLSVMGALGGFLIGTLVGIVAGSLCIAWQEETVVLKKDGTEWNKEVVVNHTNQNNPTLQA
ncbi:DUF6114 domain-containing protein [Salirhabdus sp. Marseille-P4669]|uniref:DUF6114 domain-containing protein n=1 Tax=Salirhabdus sp. Marseille-P4669 TaxID=2042310 RepID=UPI00190EABDB|nr:DUF6114 domain-containing protein [Salirhabdus sp. Marseille-P4669]